MNKLNIETICDTESFKSLRSEWDELLQKSYTNCLFLTWEWLYSWWTAYHANKELNIICVRESNNTLVGIAPLFIHKTKYYKTKVVELTFIGEATSDRQDFIVDKNHFKAYEAIISFILTRKKWTVARLEQVPEWSPMISNKQLVAQYEIEVTSHLPVIKIISDWETYYKGLSSKFKRDLKHKNNVLKREGEWGYTIKDELDNIEDELGELFKIELKSKKNNAGTAFFADERARIFQQIVSKYCTERGWLNISCIKVNKNPVSYLIGYIYNNTYLAYNMAFLPEYYRASPGKLVLHETIKHCFNRNLREFDFLRGDTYIKNKWAKTSRTNYRIVIFNKGIKASVLRRAVFTIRPFLQKHRDNKFISRLINIWRK